MEGKTFTWIENRIKAAIDQHFQYEKRISDKEYIRTIRLYRIGGILQAALFLLPSDRYEQCKMYCYEKHGYDPGGCASRQVNIAEWLRYKEEGT